LGLTTPTLPVVRSAKFFLNTTDPVDADFTANELENGIAVYNTTNHKLWIREAPATWRWVLLT